VINHRHCKPRIKYVVANYNKLRGKKRDMSKRAEMQCSDFNRAVMQNKTYHYFK